MIQAVIFDYGNVISLPQTDYGEALRRISGIDPNLFKDIYSEFRFDFDRGVISGVEMYRRFLVAKGYAALADDQKRLEQLVELDLASWRGVSQEVTDWALSLKAQGLKLGILSNMPAEFLRKYAKEIRLFQEADYATFSCNVKIIKPEKGIYLDVLNGLGINADEAIFFDDLPTNIATAKMLGFHAFLWQGVEKAKKDFSDCMMRS